MQALVQQVQDVALLVERLEQPAQPVHVREFREPHQVGFAGDHHVGLVLARMHGEGTLRQRDRVHHQAIHLLAGFLQLRDQLRAHAREFLAAELVVQVGAGAPQFIGREMPVELQDAVLHVAPVDDQDREHAVAGKPDEFDLRKRCVRLARHGDDARQMRQARDELRGGRDQRLRVAGPRLQLCAATRRSRAVPGGW